MEKKCDVEISRGTPVHGNTRVRCGQKLQEVTKVVGGKETTVSGCPTHDWWIFTNQGR